LQVGTQRIARLAHRMGITTPLSTNPAMTIGGLTVGVTPLDMAHSYETIAHGGRRVSGSLAKENAPVGIQEVEAGGRPLPDGARLDRNRVVLTPVLPSGIAQTETSMLETVLQYGTARAAAIGQFAAGKTGTTTNYGDAWFIGWDSKYTVAVWVGYPDKLVPMTTEFNGGPVLGGTFPALIWHDFMTSALQIDKTRAESATAGKGASGKAGVGPSTTGAPETRSPSPTNTPPAHATTPTGAGKANGGPSTPGGAGNEAGAPHPEKAAPATPAPAGESPSATPAPSSPAAPSSPSPTGGVSPSG
jgi:penicillin-binding protein 1A